MHISIDIASAINIKFGLGASFIIRSSLCCIIILHCMVWGELCFMEVSWNMVRSGEQICVDTSYRIKVLNALCMYVHASTCSSFWKCRMG